MWAVAAMMRAAATDSGYRTPRLHRTFFRSTFSFHSIVSCHSTPPSPFQRFDDTSDDEEEEGGEEQGAHCSEVDKAGGV